MPALPTSSETRTFIVVENDPLHESLFGRLSFSDPHDPLLSHTTAITRLHLEEGDTVEVTVRVVSRMKRSRLPEPMPEGQGPEPGSDIGALRKLIGTFTRRCAPDCPGWCVTEDSGEPEIQRCDECANLNDAAFVLTDDAVRLLPEARSELHCVTHHR